MAGRIVLSQKKDNNNRLETWIHLDWAKAYSMLGEVEESVREGRDFYVKAQAMQSPHILTRARRFADDLMKEYEDEQIVKNFHEEVHTTGELP